MYSGPILVDETFCKKNGCESNPSECGLYPSSCALECAMKNMENLLQIINTHYALKTDVRSIREVTKSKNLLSILKEYKE